MNIDLPSASADFPSSTLLANLQAQGVNYIRLFLSADFLDHIYTGRTCFGVSYPTAYLTNLTTTVDAATSMGMLVGLNLAYTNPNCLLTPSVVALFTGTQGDGSWTMPMPGEDVLNALSGLVQSFGANSLVAFEPFNEPWVCVDTILGMTLFGSGAGSALCNGTEPQDAAFMATGGFIEQDGILYQAPGLNQLYAAVRDHSNDLVVIDANNFGTNAESLLSPALVPMTNVVYAFHYYPCNADGQCSSADPANPDVVAGQLQAEMHDPAGGTWPHPVVLNEFGFPSVALSYDGSPITSPAPGAELVAAASYMNDVGIGWAVFDLNDDAAADDIWQVASSYSPFAWNTEGQALAACFTTCTASQ